LTDNVLVRLFSVAAHDLKLDERISEFIDVKEIDVGYYNIPLEWFEQSIDAIEVNPLFLSLKKANPDFPTYIKCLCELHKRRYKFQKILNLQPIPEMIQIINRCLLEYGIFPPKTLASWLIWRKWIYDIDNRSAQETGYLFEPILTSSIGGVSYSASKSPIRRTGDTTKGRQVDCIYDDFAYEFKMRVTIAASGQGRFKEELSYAEDCKSSGYKPVLIVLDPTPSARLDELIKEYEEYNG
ncbi:unnamed protein product, partial [marine sediment metagenome]